jgi:protein required for attachment to host cells
MPETLKMMESLVLVANDQGAILSRNSDGVSHLIQKIACNCMESADNRESQADLVGKDRHARGKFACALIEMLERHAEGHRYDSVIILADASIYDELRRAGSCKLSRLPAAHLIGPKTAPRVMQ